MYTHLMSLMRFCAWKTRNEWLMHLFFFVCAHIRRSLTVMLKEIYVDALESRVLIGRCRQI